MVREVITLNIGECGVRLGYNVWRQYCKEHNINTDGIKTKSDDGSFQTFFEQTGGGEFVARNLMIDLEPNIIDEVRNSKYSSIFHPEFVLSGKEDAANIFARGHYTVGKEMIDKVNDRLRKFIDACDNTQGFIINHSVGGGTGAGLGSLILERIATDYRKKEKIGFEIYPSNNHQNQISNCIVEPYNALLTTHWLLDHTEVSYLFDNSKLYNLCRYNLEIETPTYNDLNSLITKIESSVTTSLRNESEVNMDLFEIRIGMVAWPRLHFITPSIAPIINNSEINWISVSPKGTQILVDGFIRCNWSYSQSHKNVNIQLLQYEPPIYEDLLNLIYQRYTDYFKEYKKKYYQLNNVDDLLFMCADPEYFMIECNDFDAEEDKSISVQAIGFGNIKSKEFNAGIQSLKSNKKVVNEWTPTGFKTGFNKYCLPLIEGDTIKFKNKMVTMCHNNVWISRFFKERICKKYDVMYSQRAYVHWYVAEGMEEGEFVEAREELGFLEMDYLDILTESVTSSEEESSSD